MSQPSTLIVPVESQVRELDAKLLLACAAAERGFPVVLGSRALLHHAVADLPRGVYLAKSMRGLSDRMFGILHGLGHAIAAFEEEGLVRLPDPEYYRRRLSAKALGLVSLLLCWGEDDARLFRAFPAYPGTPIRVTGNPRVDLLRAELRDYWAEEVAALRRRHGEFVLVNTNFGQLNHFFPGLGEMSAALAHRTLDEARRSPDYGTRRAAYRKQIFEAFRELLPRLARELGERRVVVRPHPSESHEIWRAAARSHPNVHVLNEGSVVPWLIAARALVHNGCTTAVEAYVLGTPPIAWQPIFDAELDDPLPNGLSYRVSDFTSLGKTLGEALAGELRPGADSARAALVARHLSALDGPLAADRMVDALAEAGFLAAPPPRAPLARRTQAWLHVRGRTLVKRVQMRRRGNRNSEDYLRHRWPTLSADEVQARIDRLGRTLGRFAGVRARALRDQIFAIRG
jgi:surface carbohydrate biosynthesis protein